VGRAEGLAAIEQAVAGAARGRGAVVLVAGEAGIGKTRLAVEALRARPDDLLLLWGSCSDGDGAPPFWPWAEALRPLVGRRAMPPEVVALLPLLAPVGSARPEIVAHEIRFRAFNLVADLLDDLGRRRPVAVVLDDLHWVDPSSLELLRALAQRAGTSHFTVVGTYRDTDVGPGHLLQPVLGDLARAGARVALSGLTPSDVAELLGAAEDDLDAQATADSVAMRTGGNPFFVRELLRSGSADDVPPAVRDVLLRRVDLLSPTARACIDAAAVIGHVDVDLLTSVLHEEPLAVLDAIEELVGSRLLVVSELGRAAFAHALVRETALSALSARRTVELHGRVADAVEIRSGPVEVEVIAHHRVQSATLDPAAAVAWAAEAGRVARRQLAYEQAVRWFERAVDLSPAATRERAELLVELAEAAARSWQTLDRSRSAASEAAELARRLGEPELLAEAAIAFGGPFLGVLTSGFAEREPIALAEEALASLPPEPSLPRIRLLSRVATGLGFTPDHERALHCADRALEAARVVGDDDALIEAFTAVTSIWDPADEPAARPLLDELETVSRRRGSREGLVTVAVNRCLLALGDGDRAELEGRVAQLSALLGELHLPVHGAYVGLFRAMLHRLDGRYLEAEAELLTAMAGLGDQADGFVPGGAQLMVVWNEQDRLGEVIDDARLLFGSERFRGVPSGRVVLAYFEAVAGDRSVAADALPALAASWSATQRDPNWLMGLAWLCRTAVVLEDREAAATLLALGRPHASRMVCTAAGTITLGVLGMWLAEAAILLGRTGEAVELLDGAEAGYHRLQDRGHLVECAYLRARAALAEGRPDAAALLGAAAAEADGLGMVRVARLGRDAQRATAPSVAPVDRPPGQGQFRREGHVWLVGFGGLEARVRHSKGMADLAGLLARPGVEVHVAELVGAGSLERSMSADPVLDETAIAAYRARLRALSIEEDEADAAGDREGSIRARIEREAITDQLAADLGLGGRARSAPDWVERARKAVRRRVAAALTRIEAEHPGAGRHLRRSVRTGAFCTYDPAEPVVWET
jgi:tetratricopeptide (TPR) repeat protein